MMGRYTYLSDRIEDAMTLAVAAGWGLVRVRDASAPTGYRLTPCTVFATLTELAVAVADVERLRLTLAGAGTFANGPSYGIDRALGALEDELDRLVSEWIRPVLEDLEDGRGLEPAQVSALARWREAERERTDEA